jgi:hypothetical protein
MPDQHAKDGNFEQFFLRHKPDCSMKAGITQDNRIQISGMVGAKNKGPLRGDILRPVDGQG